MSARLLFALLLLSPSIAVADGPLHWPQFRGPTGQGHAAGATLPLSWSETENVVWKTPLSGRGRSSPVVWGEQVWVTSEPGDGSRLSAIGFHRETGEVLHEVLVFEPESVEDIHADNTYASPTPVIEAGRLYVSFGRYGTACIDTTSGEVLWRNLDLTIEHQGGPASSPVLLGDLLILNCDGADHQYVAALDKSTGSVRWKTPRSAPQRENKIYKRAFSTPLLTETDGQPVLISVGADQTHAYRPATGEELWHVRYVGFSNVPCPVSADGMLYFVTGFYGPEVMAIRLGGRGNVTSSHLEWKYKGAVPETPSPLLLDGRLYLVSNKGVASAVDVQEGERLWLKRLGGNFSASPLSDGQHIFFCGRDGKTHIVRPGKEPEVIAENKLDAPIWASPAVSGNGLLIRTEQALYRIEDADRE